MNQTHKPFDNLHIRTAINYAVNKAVVHRHVLCRAGRAGRQLDAAGDAVLQEAQPADLRPAEGQGRDRRIRSDGDALKLDFWYPSDVARPYMPDPKGLAEAIATDLEAVGFSVTSTPPGWRTGYLADEAVGKYPMWLLGWTCDWPGPDNFLNTAFFHFQGDKPNPEFAYGPPELKAAFDAAAIAPDEATARRPGIRPRTSWPRISRPLRSSTRSRRLRPRPSSRASSAPAT